MDARLKPPVEFQESNDAQLERLEDLFTARKVNLSQEKRTELEQSIKNMVNRWKDGTSQLHRNLHDWNDHLEGVTEEASFPWPGASNITMGVAAAEARTLQATFNRSVFSGQDVFVGKTLRGQKKSDRNLLEKAVNWLASEDCNLIETLKDSPLPIFRDGTVPIMGEWERKVERAVDYQSYSTAQDFVADYPTPDDAGTSQEKYDSIIDELTNEVDAEVMVEYDYDEIVYDAPKFKQIPLARYVFYPLSIEEQKEAVIYGHVFYEFESEAKVRIKYKEYDKEEGNEAIDKAKPTSMDTWASMRESIEGIASSGDDKGAKRLENYRLVLKYDMDDDGIPERYLLTFNIDSGRILRIERYYLRKNIDCVVLFRFIRRDGRILGVSMVGDAIDQFELIDDIHRHRQNVRSITDSPAFIFPEKMKDRIDLGSDDFVWRPGITFWVPDQFMETGKTPHQMTVQNLSRDMNSADEESSIMRYLEARLGPSQAMSGQESMSDPKAPATKHLSQLRQATFRIDELIREFKRSIPHIIQLMCALYYQYGSNKVPYMDKNESGDDVEMDAKREVFRNDKMTWHLKANELALSPEFQMEKAMSLIQAAAANPLVIQSKPEILIILWNEFVKASRTDNEAELLIEVPKGADPAQMAMQKLGIDVDANAQEIMGGIEGAGQNMRTAGQPTGGAQ